MHGVRYPEEALRALADHGARYRGWLPNARAPEVFARHLATVHVPRRFYVTMLPGIPTIRVFEALACGIPWSRHPGRMPSISSALARTIWWRATRRR
jgi:spore maturation protein CgeB